MDFVGCKAALLCGDALLTYLRDDKPGLPWANWWDLPGGGREGGEAPAEATPPADAADAAEPAQPPADEPNT